MFQKLSSPARDAFNYAGSEAIHMGAPAIGSEHLLLGMLCANPVVVDGLELPAVRQLAAKLPRASAAAPSLSYDDEALEVLGAAEQKASGRPVGLEHLWQSIFDHPACRAGLVLKQAGVEQEAVLGSLNLGETVELDTQLPALGGALTDLVELARQKKIHPALGRQEESDLVIASLLRWQKNTPVLVGEPGVGKTAVAEDLACRIHAGGMPQQLAGHRLLALHLPALMAGTRYRGDLEARMEKILDWLVQNPQTVLFIDEFHQITQSGGDHSLSVAGMLKPVLARGEVKVLGATTQADYNRYLEKDRAFERRLQPIHVAEPDANKTIEILDGVRPRLQEHHGIRIPRAAIKAAVMLAEEYMPARNFPDKAIDVLDQASVIALLGGKKKLEVEEVESVVAAWAGIDRSNLVYAKEGIGIGDLGQRIKAGLVGQDLAVDTVCRALVRQSAGLAEQHKPVGGFLFLGPTGVGKTELCRLLAAELFHSPEAMVRLDMSEYSQKHDVSKLIGSPPGYVGHGEGGYLVNAIKRRPACLVVFDEIEKAHPELVTLLLQILEEGQLRDSTGQQVSFQNALIVMTSNLGARWSEHDKPQVGFQSADLGELRQERMMQDIQSFFAPELLGRLDEIVFFNPLQPEDYHQILQIQLDALAGRLAKRQIKLSWGKGLIDWLLGQYGDHAAGARGLASLLRREIEDPMAQAMTEHGQKVSRINLGASRQGLRIRVS